MLTDLKLLSLAWKYIFYKAEYNANTWPHGTEFWKSWYAETKYINV